MCGSYAQDVTPVCLFSMQLILEYQYVETIHSQGIHSQLNTSCSSLASYSDILKGFVVHSTNPWECLLRRLDLHVTPSCNLLNKTLASLMALVSFVFFSFPLWPYLHHRSSCNYIICRHWLHIPRFSFTQNAA